MKKTIAKIGYFKITPPTVDGAIPTYGSIIKLESKTSGGREYSAEPEGDSTTVYADGIPVQDVTINNGYTIKLTLLDLIDDVDKDWLGNTVDSTNHTSAEFANIPELPNIGLVISEATTDGAGKITYYYNCQVSKRPKKSGKTSEGKFEGQYAEFEISAKPREYDSLVCYTTTGNIIQNAVVDPAVKTLGSLTVTSKAGITTGKTTLTVTPTLTSGNLYMYKTAATVTLPAYNDVCNVAAGYTAWDGTADITATTGNEIVVVEADSSFKAVKAGTVTIIAKV